MEITFTEEEDTGFFTDIDISALEEIEIENQKKGFVCFECLGEANVKRIEVSENGYLYNKDGPLGEDDSVAIKSIKNKSETVVLFDRLWDKGSCLLLSLDDLFNMARKELMVLDSAAKVTFGSTSSSLLKRQDVNKTYLQERRFCIEFWKYIRTYVQRICSSADFCWILNSIVRRISKRLNSLRGQLGRLVLLPDHVYQYCSNSSGNKCMQASFHLMHAHLDLRWLHLTLQICIAKGSQGFLKNSDSPMLELETRGIQDSIDHLLQELFELAIARFNKFESKDLTRKSPFNCTCVQELWIMMQQFIDIEAKKDNGKTFWLSIDVLITNTLHSSFYQVDENESDKQHLVPSSSLFYLWFIYNIGKLYTYNGGIVVSNYPLLESVLKRGLNSEIKENDLRVYLHFFENICLNLWEPKTEPLLVFWEYYQKRLNDSFYIGGNTLDSLSVITKSALDLLSQVKTRLGDFDDISNSFQHFLRIIGLHLIRCQNNPRHWNLLKGRIYSKMSPPKILTLNQTGEHHFISLFLTLALTADLPQVSDKITDLLEANLKNKGSLSSELFKGGLALCILLAERGQSLHKVLTLLASILNSFHQDKHKELFKPYIEALSDIIDSQASLTLGQHIAIDSWISSYLCSCSSNEATRLLDVLLKIILSIAPTGPDPGHTDIVFLEKIWDQLQKYLNDMSKESSAPFQVADIAVNLSYLFFKLSNSSSYTEILKLFYNNDSCDIRLVRRFLCQILRFSEFKIVLSNLNEVIIKTWIRSNLVCSDVNHCEMKELSALVATLPEIISLSSEWALELNSLEEPLLEFMTAVHAKYESINNIFERQNLREKISNYIGGIEKWIKPLLSPLHSLDVVERLFFVIGNIIRLISPLIYVKSKPNSAMQSLLSLTLLPLSVHNPEVKIHSFILAAARKTLHFFLDGLVKLNPESDHYICRCIKELISVYVPRCLMNSGPLSSQLQISTFSLISLFNEFDSSLCKVILENICSAFLKSKARNPHANAIHGLMYIKEILQMHGSLKNVILVTVEHSLSSVLSTIMFCDEKTAVYVMAKDVAKLFFINIKKQNTPEIRECFLSVLTKLTAENLPWSSRQTFDILCFVASYDSQALTKFSPILLNNIKEIEGKRGIGYDRLLRLGYERIQTKILSVKEEIS